MAKVLKSIFGRLLGMGWSGQLISNEIEITRPCVDATVTVSAEGASTANVRDIAIVLLDNRGNAIDYAEEVTIQVFLTNDRLAEVVTGGSTGIEIDVVGWLGLYIAKKRFYATSTAAGLLDVKWTDTGTEAAYIGVRLPNGRFVMGTQALTNA